MAHVDWSITTQDVPPRRTVLGPEGMRKHLRRRVDSSEWWVVLLADQPSTMKFMTEVLPEWPEAILRGESWVTSAGLRIAGFNFPKTAVSAKAIEQAMPGTPAELGIDVLVYATQASDLSSVMFALMQFVPWLHAPDATPLGPRNVG